MADLISRAAALDAIDHERDVLIEEKRLGAEHVVVHHARRIIEELPAVDAAPVVHGRWVHKERHRKSYRQYTGYDAAGEMHTIMVLEESEGKELYCSECEAQAAESFMDFCPHCGAKMDGEQHLAFADQSGAEYADNLTV